MWSINLKNHEGTSVFAIFDGHGGAKVANYMGENILSKFEALTDVFNEKAICDLCLDIDRQYLDSCIDKKELIGTTGNFFVDTCSVTFLT
jgi:serine/threonine protein phosphatase PrpC